MKKEEELLGSKIQAVLDEFGRSTLEKAAKLFKEDCQKKDIYNVNNLNLSLHIQVITHGESDKFIVEYNDQKNDTSHD